MEAVRELQELAYMLDKYIDKHDNSKNLDVAADCIADELAKRDVVVSEVTVTMTYDVLVKHNSNVEEHDVVLAAHAYVDGGAQPCWRYDYDVQPCSKANDWDTEVDF